MLLVVAIGACSEDNRGGAGRPPVSEAVTGGAGGPPVSEAVTAFNPGVNTTNRSFAVLNAQARTHRDELRTAALAHLHDRDANLHYAAVYALELTAEPGKGSAELEQMLGAASATDRMLAAGSLISMGDKTAIPVLIAALSSSAPLAYQDPEQSAFEFAQAELGYYTSQDFGLKAATGLAAVSATQPAWQKWWATRGSALRFDSTTRKYTP